MVTGRNKVDSNLSVEDTGNPIFSVNQRGFTLIELLIAMFIFSIVVSSVYGAYRSAFHVIHGSEYQLHVANSARVVLERLSEDLDAIVPGEEEVFRGERQEYSGKRGDSLSFTSSAHLVLRKTDIYSGPSLIRYQVEPDNETGLLDLYRLDKVLLPGIEPDDEDDVRKHLICRGLKEFRFTYLDQDGNESEEWDTKEEQSPGQDGAEGTSSLPSLVYVELVFADSAESDNSTVFKTAVALP
jgi:general secretion pathway protein J